MRRALGVMKAAVKAVAGVVLALVAGAAVLVALVVGGAVGVARTPWGGERLRRLVLPRLNEAIAGLLECDRLRFGGDRLVLEGLALRDPEGVLVASARRLEVVVRLWPLVRRRIEVPLVDLDTPVVSLLRDADGGSNLARAISPRHPGPATPDVPAPAAGGGAGQPWGGGARFALGALRIRSGTIESRDQAIATEGKELRVEGLTLLVTGHGDTRAGAETGRRRATIHRSLRNHHHAANPNRHRSPGALLPGSMGRQRASGHRPARAGAGGVGVCGAV